MIIEKYYKKQRCKRITDPFAKLDFLFEFPYLKCYVPTVKIQWRNNWTNLAQLFCSNYFFLNNFFIESQRK